MKRRTFIKKTGAAALGPMVKGIGEFGSAPELRRDPG